MTKTIKKINEKIKNKCAKVVTAEEMTRMVKEKGPQQAAEEVDVVTTGTFGAMCSSGVWINFGHSEPPIKMSKAWINHVEAYTGVAAVDVYLGATQQSEVSGINYGGAHVIEDLVKRKPVMLRATARRTDCYPRTEIETQLSLEDLNQVTMSNPRNAYQKYNSATNSSEKTLYTYMGKLLPRFGNITYSGAGELSPLMNDPTFETIGLGTRIFLGGSSGYIVGRGTQHDPKTGMSTLMVQGDLKKMSAKFLRAATFKGYGCSLYVGIGVPIPVLNAGVAKRTGISDGEIFTSVLDYGVPSRKRPIIKRVTYKELKSGLVEIKSIQVKTSSLSSYYLAKKIAELLKKWIEKGRFFLSEAVEKLPLREDSTGMAQRKPYPENIFVQEEIQLPKDYPLYRVEERCIHCGLCISYCPFEVFTYGGHRIVSVDDSKCTQCRLCEDVCPVKAIVLPGQR